MKGWRTVVFNVVTILVGIAANNSAELQAIAPWFTADLLVKINVVGNLILRVLTTTPVGRSTNA